MSRATHNSTRGATNSHAVKVVASTWARDSQDLYDYESQQFHAQTFNVQSTMTCIRSGCEVDVQTEQKEVPPGADTLIRVVERSGTFWVDKAMAANSRKLWMVVRHVAPSGYRLTEGDVIKLGRFTFRVRQLVTKDMGDISPDLGLDDTSTCACPDATEDMESKACRICLMEGPGEDDPLITPCQCKGSIEHVHLKCLRYWLKSRLNVSENPLGSYYYHPLPCELCKTNFPSYMKTPSGERPMLLDELPRTQAPFVVLESTVRDSRQRSRGFHVISLAEKALTLGRSHESDVRIADVSISRCHAVIRFEKGQFLLKDSDSKFGTLVAMKRPRQIEASKPLSVQIGRTMLSLSLSPRDTLDASALVASPGAALAACAVLPPAAQAAVSPPATRTVPTVTEEERRQSLRLLSLTSGGRGLGGFLFGGSRRFNVAGGDGTLPGIAGGAGRAPTPEEVGGRLRRQMSF